LITPCLGKGEWHGQLWLAEATAFMTRHTFDLAVDIFGQRQSHDNWKIKAANHE
jgi:hypothetical protein